MFTTAKRKGFCGKTKEQRQIWIFLLQLLVYKLGKKGAWINFHSRSFYPKLVGSRWFLLQSMENVIFAAETSPQTLIFFLPLCSPWFLVSLDLLTYSPLLLTATTSGDKTITVQVFPGEGVEQWERSIEWWHRSVKQFWLDGQLIACR